MNEESRENENIPVLFFVVHNINYRTDTRSLVHILDICAERQYLLDGQSTLVVSRRWFVFIPGLCADCVVLEG